MPKKKETTTAKRSVNKSQFVRDLPLTMSARDVVAKGKAEGITLSDKYVYNIRAKAKSQGGGAPRKRGRPAGAGRAAAAPAAGADTRFIDLALELGLSKAEALLEKLRNAIHQVRRG